MAKNLKLKIKNTQLAKAVKLTGLKSKLKKKKDEDSQEDESKVKKAKASPAPQQDDAPIKRRAKKKSAFATPEETDENQELELSTQDSNEEVLSTEENATEVIAEEKSQASNTEVLLKEEETPKDEVPTVEEVSSVVETVEVQEEKQEEETLEEEAPLPPDTTDDSTAKKDGDAALRKKDKKKGVKSEASESNDSEDSEKKYKAKAPKSVKKPSDSGKSFDSRDRRGLRAGGKDEQWRKKRNFKNSAALRKSNPEPVIRPTSLSVRIPISIKDLAAEMKLKSSQLISKLFMQGLVLTLNDYLDDETTLQLLGHEFGCEISIDTSEEERIRITELDIKEEISQIDPANLTHRAPVIAFMGHVDHGKTSLIDAIRKSNKASSEAGAITQHIGAFQYKSSKGNITILDTPGHEAFSAMRARGADVTDIVILVIAGDEGLRQQSTEAVQHAKAAGVPILVAINKSDKPNFNADEVYRQLSEIELLPEAWGGSTITVNCSAVTGEGIEELLEMVSLQAEMMELKASTTHRARGRILESEMHKGLGNVATVLIQNGTLKKGDALVTGAHSGHVKTMRNEGGKDLNEAPPSFAVEITGLSGLPQAGDEFIVVESEKEAKSIAQARQEQDRGRQILQQRKGINLENLLQEAQESSKKVLNLILRADMQGSLEALKAALCKIDSDKVDLNIIFSGAGEISESDIQLAAASKAAIIGFHTQIESHAASLIKQYAVPVYTHDIIYHAIDNVRSLMTGMLDSLSEERDVGFATVRAVFKSSALGLIAGCIVEDGIVKRNAKARIVRDGETIWNGSISSLKREKDDVREVKAGLECGILLDGFNAVKEDDKIEVFEIIHVQQEL